MRVVLAMTASYVYRDLDPIYIWTRAKGLLA